MKEDYDQIKTNKKRPSINDSRLNQTILENNTGRIWYEEKISLLEEQNKHLQAEMIALKSLNSKHQQENQDITKEM